MSDSIAVLLGLLVVAYVGSMLVGGRTIRGFGLPSGAEYLVLGVVAGPHVLGLLPRSAIHGFEPIFVCAAAWLALVAGLGYLIVGTRRVRLGRALAGIVSAAFVAAVVSGALFLLLGHYQLLDGYPRLELALGAGFVGCETTRHTVRWVAERHGAYGPLSDWLADMARASAIVPVLGLGYLFAIAPDAPLAALVVPARVGIGLALGVLLGLVAAVLLGREFRRDESWGILLGTSVLAAGVAARMGLAPVATLFMMGLTLALVSRHRLDIKAMVGQTEKPVLLPVVLVAGACVDFKPIANIGTVVAVALCARFAAELLRGLFFSAFVRAARQAGPSLGLGMLSSGSISIALAFTLAVRSPGPAGDGVLLLAAAGVLFGEVIGPAMLRRSLGRAGEIHEGEASDPATLSLVPEDPTRRSQPAGRSSLPGAPR